MSGLYIPNMTLPENNNWKTIRIYKNGEVAYPNWQGDCTFANTHAIPVPDHGRLIDTDALGKTLEFIGEAEAQIYGHNSWRFVNKCRQALEDAPTVIPASGKEA